MSSLVTKAEAIPSRHQAAVLVKVGQPFEVEERTTPHPGPNQLLIEVHSIAMNPVDHFQRDYGFHVSHTPAILGSDISGIVVAAGSSVSESLAKVGNRVTASARAFYAEGEPDYGAFQKYVIVPAGNAATIPDTMGFNEAAVLPMAVVTAQAGWYTIDLPRDTKHLVSDKQGLLVWGAASSVGGAAVQSAKAMGFVVYATASPHNYSAVKSLGVHKVFDYKDPDVVADIVAACKQDGFSMNIAYNAAAHSNNPLIQVLA